MGGEKGSYYEVYSKFDDDTIEKMKRLRGKRNPFAPKAKGIRLPTDSNMQQVLEKIYGEDAKIADLIEAEEKFKKHQPKKP